MAGAQHREKRRTRRSAMALREVSLGKRGMRLFLRLIVIAAAFALGFFVRSQTAFVTSLGFPVDDRSALVGESTALKTEYNSISLRVSELEKLLVENSLNEYDMQAATLAIMDSLMKSTDDPNATYFDSERYAAYIEEKIGSDYEGVGVLFSDDQGRACAVEVLEGSEAEAKGVERGDIVVAIDGDRSHEWGLAETVSALTRRSDSEAVITWVRPSLEEAENREFTTTLACKAYNAINVSSQLMGTTGYIKVRQITERTSEYVSSAVKSLLSSGATSFVLDLRDNPGGYLNQAVDTASLFVKSGTLVQIQGIEGVTAKTASGVTLTDAPVAVIVNERTSASAEVLAAALQDNQRAKVVGRTTAGKGSIQVTRELSFGGAVRYTAAYCKSPLGHDINGVGVRPEISVQNAEGSDEDAQLQIALSSVGGTPTPEAAQ